MIYRTTVGQTRQRAEIFLVFHIDLLYTNNLIFSYRINIVSGHFPFWNYDISGSFNEAISQLGLDNGKGGG